LYSVICQITEKPFLHRFVPTKWSDVSMARSADSRSMLQQLCHLKTITMTKHIFVISCVLDAICCSFLLHLLPIICTQYNNRGNRTREAKTIIRYTDTL